MSTDAAVLPPNPIVSAEHMAPGQDPWHPAGDHVLITVGTDNSTTTLRLTVEDGVRLHYALRDALEARHHHAVLAGCVPEEGPRSACHNAAVIRGLDGSLVCFICLAPLLDPPEG